MLHTAGFCTRSPVEEATVRNLLNKTLEIGGIPAKHLVDDWTAIWSAGS